MDEEHCAREALQDLAVLYLSELPAMVQLIRQDVTLSQAKNEASLLSIAAGRTHQLRGTAGALGFLEISKIAGRLDHCLSDAAGLDQSCAPADYTAISNLVVQLEQAIQTEQAHDSALPILL